MENSVLSSLLYLTNWTDEDFIAKWNGTQYLLPANKMTPVVVSTPEDNQAIRKLWALKLCERELNKQERFAKQMWTDVDLKPLMEKCLTSLEKSEPIRMPAEVTQREIERKANIESTFVPAESITNTLNQGSPLA